MITPLDGADVPMYVLKGFINFLLSQIGIENVGKIWQVCKIDDSRPMTTLPCLCSYHMFFLANQNARYIVVIL
jgi:hypothetical protein